MYLHVVNEQSVLMRKCWFHGSIDSGRGMGLETGSTFVQKRTHDVTFYVPFGCTALQCQCTTILVQGLLSMLNARLHATCTHIRD